MFEQFLYGGNQIILGWKVVKCNAKLFEQRRLLPSQLKNKQTTMYFCIFLIPVISEHSVELVS